MKKVSCLVVGLLLFGVSRANATNVIDGNPFYNPKQGRFYDVFTPVGINTKFERFVMTNELGYGVSDAFSVRVVTSGSYDSSDNPEFGKWSWNDLNFGFDWDLWHQGETVAEVYGDVKQIYNTKHNLQTVAYNWSLGARVGRLADNWVMAGIVQVDYLNDDLPEDTFDAWAMTVGMQGQYILNNRWNLVAGLMFDFDLFDKYYDGEQLRLEFGVNYNFDATKYIGFAVNKDVVHSFEYAPLWFNVKFGIDF